VGRDLISRVGASSMNAFPLVITPNSKLENVAISDASTGQDGGRVRRSFRKRTGRGTGKGKGKGKPKGKEEERGKGQAKGKAEGKTKGKGKARDNEIRGVHMQLLTFLDCCTFYADARHY
jgi:hypothetical protein